MGRPVWPRAAGVGCARRGAQGSVPDTASWVGQLAAPPGPSGAHALAVRTRASRLASWPDCHRPGGLSRHAEDGRPGCVVASWPWRRRQMAKSAPLAAGSHLVCVADPPNRARPIQNSPPHGPKWRPNMFPRNQTQTAAGGYLGERRSRRSTALAIASGQFPGIARPSQDLSLGA